VLGSVTSLIGSLQAMEALKILSGHADCVRRKIFTADLWHGPIRETGMPLRDLDCPCCGRRDFVFLNGRRAPVSLCGRNAVQIHERLKPLDLERLAQQLEGLGTVRRNEFALRFVSGDYELTIFPDGRAIIKGTTDIGLARSLYSRYIGN
jgi:adenylyltransferase/sulfurtransferase